MADARAGSDADSAPADGGERDDHDDYDDRGDFADDAVPPPGPAPSGWRQRLLSMAGKPADIAAAAPGLTGLMAARRARKAAKKAKRSAGASETKEEFATHSAMPRAVRRYEHPRGTAIAKRTRDGSERQTRHVSIDLEAMRANGMLTLDEERSVIAEEFRLVKRPLLLRAFAEGEDRIRHGNLIMVSSGRPGEGKTFCSVNLAMSIALERDLTVMLIDADVAKPSVPSVLGFEAELGLIDLIADDGLDVADVLVRTDIENLTILPAGRPHHLATELLASERMEQLIVELAERYPDRVIIIDSSPVLMSSIPGVLALYVGQIVFVVQAEKSTQSSIDAALGLISACENIYLLLNKTRSIGGAEKFGAYYGYYR